MNLDTINIKFKAMSDKMKNNLKHPIQMLNKLKNKTIDAGKTISNFTKNISKNTNHSLKKLALGLLGVRTIMSVLTKSVHAYLSFDSELQDSINNSWNMLGALLAPAIELVARMFAMATNYVAQFVSALSGIDLVARANAKALESQAKANKKANNAQRGLLSMDEITNLPTENAGSSANQIQIDDTIKSFKFLDKILSDLKNGEWHILGEDIASEIDKLLSSIKWDEIKQKAYNLGYNFADFLNGLFEVDWGQIGNTIAQTYNTFVKLLHGFVEKFSFTQFGKGLATSINEAILNFDWNELAETINDGIKGVGDAIDLFLTTFKWGDIGEKFGEFIRNIDWGKLLYNILLHVGELAFGLLDFFVSFLYKAFGESFVEMGYALGDAMSDLGDNIKNTIDKIGKGIRSVMKSTINAIISLLNLGISAINTIMIPARALIVAFGKVTGKHWTMDNIKIPKIPLLEVGTPNIQAEGLYHLHEGEMVVPKKYNPNTDGYDSGKDNKQIIDLLISLNANMIEYSERPMYFNVNGRRFAEAIYDDTESVRRSRGSSDVVKIT